MKLLLEMLNGTVEPKMIARIFIIVSALAIAGCNRKTDDRVQGYVEGDFVYVASPLPGALEILSVQRGAQVKAGDPLFVLDSALETAARDLAARRIDEARARLADAKKGLRESEMTSLEAQLNQSKAALALAEKEFARQSGLAASHVSSPQDLDKAKAARDQDRQRVTQLEAELKTAQLGSRVDQIAAAESNVRALEAALAKAEWDLAQKRQNAPQTGLVFDTLFWPGEWVPAGRPVISLLPPANIKVRAFVPEPRVGTIRTGGAARVSVDGVADSFTGKVSFISPRAEYTPPVIYSQESRGKLVFMIEITFDPATAAKLHPGQPVDVNF
jgi:HlyD family secretion protein